MPLEQLNGSLSLKTDIWAFACVLLEFCTGLKPFNYIEQDITVSLRIFNGISPLDHALEKYNLSEIDLITENNDLKTLL